MGFSPQRVQAAGRTISAKNAEKIKAGLAAIDGGRAEIAAVLASAGHLEAVSAASAQEVSASSLRESVAWENWFSRLRTILYSFYRYYIQLHLMPLADIRTYVSDQVESEADRQQAIAETIDDLEQLLRDLSGDCPQLGSGISEYQTLEMSAADAGAEIEAGMLAEHVERTSWVDELYNILDVSRTRYKHLHLLPLDSLREIDSEEARQDAIAAEIGELKELLVEHASRSPGPHEVAAAAVPETEFEVGQTIEAAAIGLEVSLEVGVDEISPEAAGLVEVAIEASRGGNLYPFEGVLFRVGEPSDSPPSIGPRLPLYIPQDVAESVLDVANLPLEAAADLTGHDRQGTCGVMTAATIEGNEFRVQGFIWPWNYGQKVSKILAAKRQLGMSMNAAIAGEVAIIGGQKVHRVSHLELRGGCILLAELASWQKTRIAAAASADCPDSHPGAEPIAASAQLLNPSTSIGAVQPMNGNETSDPVLSHITALTSSIDRFKTEIGGQIQNLQGTMGDLGSRVAALEQAQQAEVQAKAVANRQVQEQQQREVLAKALGDAVGERLKPLAEGLQAVQDALPGAVEQAVQQRLNPRGVPARRVAPVVPAGATQDLQGDEQQNIALKIARIDGQLEESGNQSLTKTFALLDQRRRLEEMLPVNVS